MPTPVRLRATSTALLLLGLCAACDAPLEPLLPAGTFALQAFASHPLPAVTSESVVARESIIADTLVIEADGRGIRRLTRRTEFLDGSRVPEESRRDTELTIASKGAHLVITEQVFCLDSHAVEECGPLPATLSGSTLDIGPRRYTRVIAAP